MDPSLLLAVSLALFVGAALLLVLTLGVAGYTWWMIRQAEAAEAVRLADEPDFAHLRSGPAVEQTVPVVAAQSTENDEEDVDDMATEVFSPELLGTSPSSSAGYPGGGFDSER